MSDSDTLDKTDTDQLTLAIETAQATGSVALGLGKIILGSIELSRDKRDRKGEELMPAIQSLFQAHGYTPADLKRVLISTGPGSFTGLRVGITVAKMLGQFGGVTLYPISTLAATAWQVYDRLAGDADRDIPLAVALAVKQQTVYGEIFSFTDGMPEAFHPTEVMGRLVPMTELILGGLRQQIAVEWPDRLTDLLEGSAPEKIEEIFVIRDKRLAELHAASVYQYGCRLLQSQKLPAVDPLVLTPEYIRPPEAVTLWDARHGPESPEGSEA